MKNKSGSNNNKKKLIQQTLIAYVNHVLLAYLNDINIGI